MDDLTIDDPANILGMSHLIDQTGVQNGFNLHELEEQITGGTRKHKKTNLAQDLESEIDKLTGGFQKPDPMIPFDRPTMTTSDDLEALLQSMDDEDGPSAPPQRATAAYPRQGETYPRQNEPHTAHSSYFPDEEPEDPDLAYRTNEQKRQNVIGTVMADMDEEYGSQPAFSVEKEKEEDEKSRKLEAIESLREILMDEGENLDRIPNVTSTSSMADIDGVYKMLNMKNDRKRCTTFAEEGILLGAHAVEWAFDGQKTYFGHRPDMTDWHKSVQAKLRRMRHDTSQVVGQVMQQIGMGPGTRLLFEILPSAFLYSKMRKTQHKDNLVSDAEYGNALNDLMNHQADKEH